PIHLDDEEGAGGSQAAVAGAFGGGFQGELIGDLQGGGQKTGGENGGHGAGGQTHGIEPCHEQGAIGRQRQQFEGDFRRDTQQALGADEKACQVEAGFVLVCASAEDGDRSVGEG